MAFVFRRKLSKYWWMCWTDAEGREQRASSKTTDEAEAKATADELERRARASRGGRRAPAGSLTVEKFFDESWLPLRQKIRPWQWKADRAAMRTHFLPEFGSRVISDLATDEGEVALLDWLIALREHPSRRDGSPIAARTVRNVASCVRVFFADAAERKVLRRNPTIGWDAERHMPPVVDKKRGWRATAGFSLDQVVTLTTDPRIPQDRRVLYAIRFLGGPRPGEVANARWRNIDRTRRPLWRPPSRPHSTAPCAGRRTPRPAQSSTSPFTRCSSGCLRSGKPPVGSSTWAGSPAAKTSSSRARTASNAS
jgi:integrase